MGFPAATEYEIRNFADKPPFLILSRHQVKWRTLYVWNSMNDGHYKEFSAWYPVPLDDSLYEWRTTGAVFKLGRASPWFDDTWTKSILFVNPHPKYSIQPSSWHRIKSFATVVKHTWLGTHHFVGFSSTNPNYVSIGDTLFRDNETGSYDNMCALIHKDWVDYSYRTKNMSTQVVNTVMGGTFTTDKYHVFRQGLDPDIARFKILLSHPPDIYKTMPPFVAFKPDQVKWQLIASSTNRSVWMPYITDGYFTGYVSTSDVFVEGVTSPDKTPGFARQILFVNPHPNFSKKPMGVWYNQHRGGSQMLVNHEGNGCDILTVEFWDDYVQLKTTNKSFIPIGASMQPLFRHGGSYGEKGVDYFYKAINRIRCVKASLVTKVPVQGTVVGGDLNVTYTSDKYAGFSYVYKNFHFEIDPANVAMITDGKWTDWKLENPDHKKCGAVRQQFSRECIFPKYGGKICDITDANTDMVGELAKSGMSYMSVINQTVCPSWDKWVKSKDCTETCGGGLSEYTRQCTGVGADTIMCLNKQGDFSSTESEMRPCNEQACPVDGEWGPWAVTRTCPDSNVIASDMMVEMRECKNQAYGGASCDGSTTREKPCVGVWSDWTTEETCQQNTGKCDLNALISYKRVCTSGELGCLTIKDIIAQEESKTDECYPENCVEYHKLQKEFPDLTTAQLEEYQQKQIDYNAELSAYQLEYKDQVAEYNAQVEKQAYMLKLYDEEVANSKVQYMDEAKASYAAQKAEYEIQKQQAIQEYKEDSLEYIEQQKAYLLAEHQNKQLTAEDQLTQDEYERQLAEYELAMEVYQKGQESNEQLAAEDSQKKKEAQALTDQLAESGDVELSESFLKKNFIIVIIVVIIAVLVLGGGAAALLISGGEEFLPQQSKNLNLSNRNTLTSV